MALPAEESEEVAELVTFQCRECYLYFPLPPALHYGHRAELWGVEDWNKVRERRCGATSRRRRSRRRRADQLLKRATTLDLPLPTTTNNNNN